MSKNEIVKDWSVKREQLITIIFVLLPPLLRYILRHDSGFLHLRNDIKVNRLFHILFSNSFSYTIIKNTK